MPSLGVQSAVVGCMDRLARWHIQCLGIHSIGAGTLWTRVDNAVDPNYENIVKGTDVAAVDSKVAGVLAGAVVKSFFDRHLDYFTAQAYGSWNDFLSRQVRFRVHENAGELYYSAYGRRLDAANVFPSASRVLGTALKNAADVWSPTAGVPSNVLGPALVEAEVLVVKSPGSVYSLTLPCQANSPSKILALTLTSAGVGSKYVIGGQPLVSLANPGASVLGVTSTGQFNVGDTILLVNGMLTERSAVTSINANIALALSSPVVNSFAIGVNVYPLFYKVNSVGAASGVNSGDSIRFQPREDRVPIW